MKKLLTLLSIVSLNLFGACLEVGTTTQTACSGNSIHIDPIANQTVSAMNVDAINQTLYFPLYVFSDSNEEVKMTLSSLSKFFKGSDDMTASYYFVAGSSNSGTAVPIIEGTAFTLLSTGTNLRDGNSIVGYIKIVVPTVAGLQTAGEYTLNVNTSVKLTNSISDTDTLTAKTTVNQVTRVSFENDVSSLTSGIGFEDATVDYGNFELNEVNIKKVDVYLKNNTAIKCTMSITPSPLKHVTYPDAYQITMSYSYKDTATNEVTPITNTTPFILKNGKNAGSKVGEMTFTTETLPDTLIAGEYKAVIEVSIQAQ